LKRSNKLQLLLAKFVFNAYVKEVFSKKNREIDLLLNEVVLSLLESKDPNFKAKHAILVRKLGLLLVFWNQSGDLQSFKARVSESGVNLSDLYLSERQFHAANKNLRQAVEGYVHRLQQTQYNKVPPARYIGVGYKDQGSRKVSHYDGSPSWQEVASSYRETNDPFLDNRFRRGVFNLVKDSTSIYDDSKQWIRLVREGVLSKLYTR
jgi:hypothetical protein